MNHSSYFIFLVIIVEICVLLVSMVLHELAHGYAAYRLGDDTAARAGRLSLNPLRHLDPVYSILMPLVLGLMGAPVIGGARPVPINKYKLRNGELGFALVALAGPLTNFLLAIVSALLYAIVFKVLGLDIASFAGTLVWYTLQLSVSMNLSLMVFNLIPIPPLDGSRILHALAPDFVRELMDRLEPMGMMILYFAVAFLNISSMIGTVVDTISSFIWRLFGI